MELIATKIFVNFLVNLSVCLFIRSSVLLYFCYLLETFFLTKVCLTPNFLPWKSGFEMLRSENVFCLSEVVLPNSTYI
jgi:hypothetical protein